MYLYQKWIIRWTMIFNIKQWDFIRNFDPLIIVTHRCPRLHSLWTKKNCQKYIILPEHSKENRFLHVKKKLGWPGRSIGNWCQWCRRMLNTMSIYTRELSSKFIAIKNPLQQCVITSIFLLRRPSSQHPNVWVEQHLVEPNTIPKWVWEYCA